MHIATQRMGFLANTRFIRKLEYTITTDTYNFDVVTAFNNPTVAGDYEVTINEDITVGGDLSSEAAAFTASALPGNSTLTIKMKNGSRIQGRGGVGGYGRLWYGPYRSAGGGGGQGAWPGTGGLGGTDGEDGTRESPGLGGPTWGTSHPTITWRPGEDGRVGLELEMDVDIEIAQGDTASILGGGGGGEPPWASTGGAGAGGSAGEDGQEADGTAGVGLGGKAIERGGFSYTLTGTGALSITGVDS